jgi:hypothetical protein
VHRDEVERIRHRSGPPRDRGVPPFPEFTGGQ